MKQWFNSILNLIKDNKLTVLYILIGIVALFLIVLTIVVCVKKKSKYTPTYSDKSDFVHKVMKYDSSALHQLLTAATVGLLIAAIVLFCVKLVIPAAIVAIVFLACWIWKILLNIRVRFCRFEYNNAEIYRFSFMAKTKVMRWEDIDKVEPKGFGSTRKILFISKDKTKISVPLDMTGYYDFTVFAEKKLDGKNFEAIKVAKARR